MTSDSEDKWIKERLAELEDENRELRRSSNRFGELAERLSVQLHHERRLSVERRSAARNSGDRRHYRNGDQS